VLLLGVAQIRDSQRSKRNSATAKALAEEVVAGIQGAIVLARALDDPRAFSRALERMRDRLEKP
jgi:hypothetical protein